jgi:hypothetical protein
MVLTGRTETREILKWLLDCSAYLEGLDIDTLLLPIHELGLSVWRRVMKLKGIHILEVPPYFLTSAMSIFGVILVINDILVSVEGCRLLQLEVELIVVAEVRATLFLFYAEKVEVIIPLRLHNAVVVNFLLRIIIEECVKVLFWQWQLSDISLLISLAHIFERFVTGLVSNGHNLVGIDNGGVGVTGLALAIVGPGHEISQILLLKIDLVFIEQGPAVVTKALTQHIFL